MEVEMQVDCWDVSSASASGMETNNRDSDMDFTEMSQIDIDTVECIPDVIINSFEADALPDVGDQRAFFLTKASSRIFSDMKASRFFNCLRTSSCWKLYVSELMFGTLFFEAPWEETFQSNYLLRKLRDQGKIVVLQRNLPVTVPLSPTSLAVTNCTALTVTHMKHGQISQMLEFIISKTDKPDLVITHLGTCILDDIIVHGGCEIQPPPKGFPTIFKESQSTDVCLDTRLPATGSTCQSIPNSDVSDSELSQSLLGSGSLVSSFPDANSLPPTPVSQLTSAFSDTLESIRRRLAETPNVIQFKIVTSGADKLVSLWYMKHLSEEFGFKVHVDEYYFTIVKKYLPSFADFFSPHNLQGQCRFHYNCSSKCCSRELDKSCIPFLNVANYVVDFICIGFWKDKPPRNLRIPKTSYCIPFLHEVVYDF